MSNSFRDEITKFRGTTLIPLKKRHLSDSIKSIACNGAYRIQLLAMLSRDLLWSQMPVTFGTGSHHPPAL